MLLIASYIFYGWWDWRFLGLIALSTVIDYIIGIQMHKSSVIKRRRWLLFLTCLVNLGLLMFFKYFNFFIEGFSDVLSFFHMNANLSTLNIILPVGISFYTFQTMSYTIDIYRKQMPPTKNFWDFALFVSFFPQLVAGPIERASKFLPQITKKREVTKDNITSGLWLILWGFFKKLVIADSLALVVNGIFDLENPTGLQCVIGVYAFAFQIYGDFSGYTDIARGIAKLMGIELMLNFKIPYLAITPSDFWRRWHISLSTWMRDYIYIPLGGNRSRGARILLNLFLTMLIGGLWHGANWNFILWGGFHGAILIIFRICRIDSFFERVKIKWLRVIQMIIMFQITCYGWLLFRASEWGQIKMFTSKIFGDWEVTPEIIPALAKLIFYVSILWLFEFIFRNTEQPNKARGWKYLKYIYVPALILLIIIFRQEGGSDFIYFQF